MIKRKIVALENVWMKDGRMIATDALWVDEADEVPIASFFALPPHERRLGTATGLERSGDEVSMLLDLYDECDLNLDEWDATVYAMPFDYVKDGPDKMIITRGRIRAISLVRKFRGV